MKKRRKLNKHGFTLSELLVVIVIMMILAGVSFVAVSRYIRNLHVLEMDNTAKEIFIVAQNHLSKSYVSGEFEREMEEQKEAGTDEEYFGTVLSSKPSYIKETLTGDEHEFRYVLYNGHASGSTKPDILSSMLPVFSIDEEISESGNYIIVYDAKSATVLGVFYSGNTHTYFGSSPVHDFNDAEAMEEDGNTDLYEAVDNKEKRKHYPDSTENSVIGRYVSGGKDVIPEGTLKPIILEVTNGAKLTAKITNPNYKMDDTGKIITLTVKGLTSKNSQTLVLTSSGKTFETSYNNVNGPAKDSGPRTYTNIGYESDTATGTEVFTFTLDDITTGNGHFCNAFPYLIPGEDVEIYAEISDTSAISTPLESNHETVNSLFDGYYSIDSTKGMAEVKNIRHLENLSLEVSNLSLSLTAASSELSALLAKASEIKVTKVNQISDIAYSGNIGLITDYAGNESFVKEIRGSVSDDGSTIPIYKYDGSTLLSQKGYYGISNSNIDSYDGLTHRIFTVHCETGVNGNTGIFAETGISGSANPFTLKNLTLVDCLFKASESAARTDPTYMNAGGLVGCNLGYLEIKSCKIISESTVSPTSISAGNGEAGGMVGYSAGNLLIDSSDVTGASSVNVSSKAASAGGLIGHSKTAPAIQNCMVDSGGLSIKSEGSGNAAGLIGHSEGAVSITKSYVYVDGLSISSVSGNAAGLIGYSEAALTVTSSSLKGDQISITSTSGDAGGLAAKCGSTVDITDGRVSGLKDGSVSGSKVTITASSANAGGLVGEAIGAVTMENSYSAGDEFTITAQNGGGIIGNAAGAVSKMELCYAAGKNYKITGTDAGGIIGVSSGGLNISNTYGSAYITATGNAGGFIGNISGGSNNTIKNCYAAGHTKSGKYGKKPEEADSSDYYNVLSDAAAGGFIGKNTVTTTVENSYTTCSVYSTSGNPSVGFAGGFAGIGRNPDEPKYLDVNNCYSAGLVSVASGGTAGGFYGLAGTASGTQKSYYLKVKEFNSGFGVAGSGTVTNIVSCTSTSSDGIAASGDTLDAVPWDEFWIESNGKGKYPYKTVAELSGVTENLSVHNGDWSVPDQNDISLRISNAEKLSAILVVPTSTLQAAGYRYASLVVQGLESGKIAYMQLLLTTTSVSLIADNQTQALANLPADSYDTSDLENIVVPSKLSSKVTTDTDGNTLFHIYLDDVTKAGCNFASLFTGFTPGEDIRIAVTSDVMSWGDVIESAQTEETSEIDPEFKASGITNSLFADGSGNGDYSTGYYSDINSETEIITPGTTETEKNRYKETAFILNFRHLQNLDKYVSGVGSDYKNAKLCRNLYWKKTNTSETNVMPEGYKAFIDEINKINNPSNANNTTIPIKIYPYDADDEDDAIAVNDSFCGIINDNIKEFDGGSHSINNLLIYNQNTGASGSDTKLNSDAGLFRYIENGSGVTMNIHDLTMIEPVVISSSGSAGGLIGDIENKALTSELKVEYVYVYGKDSLVRALDGDDGDAGGLIGTATGGAYTIKNSGASAYVYSGKDSAGGFIGDYKPKATTKITNCFVGGHVLYGTQGYEYVDNEAVDGDGVTVQNEGGYNVDGFKASGGFVGFIGTGVDPGTTITFENCFTTASVHSRKTTGNGSGDKGAAGGFVGRLQHKYQIYDNCYAAGKVFAGNCLAGAFVGHHKNYSSTNGDECPRYINDFVLTGVDFNEAEELELVNLGSNSESGSQPGYSPTGIYFVEHDSTDIVNEHSDAVELVQFNQRSEHYPYKDWSSNKYPTGTEHLVFYGDWVEPDSLSPVKVINGNRLIARITLRDDTYNVENINGEAYYVTYARLKGQLSGASVTYRIYFRNGEAHIDQMTGNSPSSHNDSKVSVVYNGATPQYVDFCIDNVSAISGNYRSSMPSDNGHSPKPGEDFTIYVSKTLTGLDGYFTFNATANSLFQKIEEIKDNSGTGTGNYIAYVANSRHLMNINSSVSSIDTGGIKVTKVVQTDNIYWIDDGTFAAQRNYQALTPPYQTELPESNVYFDYRDVGTDSGEMMALASKNLELYDGGGKAIYNAVIGTNADNSYVGLFSRNEHALTIQNLVLMSPRINHNRNFTSTGILVGLAENDLTVKNLSMFGDIEVSKGGTSGIITGSTSNNLTIDNLTVNGNVTVGAIDNSGAVAGCLVGYSGGNTSISGCGLSGTVTVYGAQIAGGLVGKAENSITLTHIALDGTLNVTGGNYSGGAIGNVTGGSCSMNDVGILAGNGLISHTIAFAQYGATGGFVGEISNTQIDIRNCYASAYVYGAGGRTGGFIGNLSGDAPCKGTVQNCYASGHTFGGIYLDNVDVTIPGHYNVIGGIGIAVGGFVGNAQGDATEKLTLKKCFSTNSLVNLSGFYAGGFAGTISDNIKVEDCYTISYQNKSYNNANVGIFAGRVSYASTINNSYCYRRSEMNGMNAIGGIINDSMVLEAGNLGPILETCNEMEDKRCDAVHNDATEGLSSKYPYKNWTDKSGSLTPGSESNIVFYGDWVD